MTERNPYHPDGLWPTAGSYTRTDEADWKARAEKAEKDKDWWIKRTELFSQMYHGTLRKQKAAEQPRTLTADAITDEMVERAAHCLAMQLMPTIYSLEPDSTADKCYDDAREVLHAALTEPPARPEGAEEWEDWLIEALPHESMPDEDIARLADQIAARAARRDEEKR